MKRFSLLLLVLLGAFSSYAHAYYNPTMGRWVSRDPIEENGGANLYGFCRNNGINALDALGNIPRFEDNTQLGKPNGIDPGEVRFNHNAKSKVARTPCGVGYARVEWEESAFGRVTGYLGDYQASINHELHHVDGYRRAWEKYTKWIESQYFNRCMCESAAKCYNEITPQIGVLAFLEGSIIADELHLNGGSYNGSVLSPYSSADISIHNVAHRINKSKALRDKILSEVVQASKKCKEKQ